MGKIAERIKKAIMDFHKAQDRFHGSDWFSFWNNEATEAESDIIELVKECCKSGETCLFYLLGGTLDEPKNVCGIGGKDNCNKAKNYSHCSYYQLARGCFEQNLSNLKGE
ncbi:MAG: hypothetical protein E3J78_02330 [Candidatus Cloacimonadota bacterium]|nr:MAG: hypothetical protein E3J78_02330 [Candidatus Cloacimonadota bacterium]